MALDVLAQKIQGITKSKERILEISGIMLDYQKTNADEMAEYWYQEFAGFTDMS